MTHQSNETTTNTSQTNQPENEPNSSSDQENYYPEKPYPHSFSPPLYRKAKKYWSEKEDQILLTNVEEVKRKNNNRIIWRQVVQGIPHRSAKQCRERWKNYIDPEINNLPLSYEEKELIKNLQRKYGNRWTFIASLLQGRTENCVKNWFHGRKHKTKGKENDYIQKRPAIYETLIEPEDIESIKNIQQTGNVHELKTQRLQRTINSDVSVKIGGHVYFERFKDNSSGDIVMGGSKSTEKERNKEKDNSLSDGNDKCSNLQNNPRAVYKKYSGNNMSIMSNTSIGNNSSEVVSDREKESDNLSAPFDFLWSTKNSDSSSKNDEAERLNQMFFD